MGGNVELVVPNVPNAEEVSDKLVDADEMSRQKKIDKLEEMLEKGTLLWRDMLQKKGDQLLFVMKREHAVVARLKRKLRSSEDRFGEGAMPDTPHHLTPAGFRDRDSSFCAADDDHSSAPATPVERSRGSRGSRGSRESQIEAADQEVGASDTVMELQDRQDDVLLNIARLFARDSDPMWKEWARKNQNRQKKALDENSTAPIADSNLNAADLSAALEAERSRAHRLEEALVEAGNLCRSVFDNYKKDVASLQTAWTSALAKAIAQVRYRRPNQNNATAGHLRGAACSSPEAAPPESRRLSALSVFGKTSSFHRLERVPSCKRGGLSHGQSLSFRTPTMPVLAELDISKYAVGKSTASGSASESVSSPRRSRPRASEDHHSESYNRSESFAVPYASRVSLSVSLPPTSPTHEDDVPLYTLRDTNMLPKSTQTQFGGGDFGPACTPTGKRSTSEPFAALRAHLVWFASTLRPIERLTEGTQSLSQQVASWSETLSVIDRALTASDAPSQEEPTDSSQGDEGRWTELFKRARDSADQGALVEEFRCIARSPPCDRYGMANQAVSKMQHPSSPARSGHSPATRRARAKEDTTGYSDTMPACRIIYEQVPRTPASYRTVRLYKANDPLADLSVTPDWYLCLPQGVLPPIIHRTPQALALVSHTRTPQEVPAIQGQRLARSTGAASICSQPPTAHAECTPPAAGKVQHRRNPRHKTWPPPEDTPLPQQTKPPAAHTHAVQENYITQILNTHNKLCSV
ncbi:hypothetical protein DIPPA_55754 [Diplonema papillatum]|nr:hypothetical protein DIPPA_55754 [Diplonema papillatum]